MTVGSSGVAQLDCKMKVRLPLPAFHSFGSKRLGRRTSRLDHGAGYFAASSHQCDRRAKTIFHALQFAARSLISVGCDEHHLYFKVAAEKVYFVGFSVFVSSCTDCCFNQQD